MKESYAVTIDHFNDLEIRQTKDGRVFGIKNIRQEFEGNIMILKADIAGNKQAANKYLKQIQKAIIQQLESRH